MKIADDIWDEIPIDFELIGLVSNKPEFNVGWCINQFGIFHLVKGKDIEIEFAREKVIRISNLVYQTEHTSVHLLSNRLYKPDTSDLSRVDFLIPELKKFDYLIKINDNLDQNLVGVLMRKLRSSDAFDYALQIDVDKVKSKENLIF